jgi:hypothetical protein
MRDKASATESVGLNVNNPDVMILSVVKSKKPFGPCGFPEMIHWRVIYGKHEAEGQPMETKKLTRRSYAEFCKGWLLLITLPVTRVRVEI